MESNIVSTVLKWVLIGVGVIVLGYVGYGAIALWIAFTPYEAEYEVQVPAVGETVYFKVVKMGINGNNQRMFLTHKPKDGIEYDSTADYFWEGLYPLYYEVKDSTLFIYSGSTANFTRPLNFPEHLKVVNIYQRNHILWQMRENYKERGLEKVD